MLKTKKFSRPLNPTDYGWIRKQYTNKLTQELTATKELQHQA